MINKIFNIIVSVLILASYFPVKSQDVASDFEKINEAYVKISEISMEMEYKAFSTFESSAPIEKTLGEIKRSGKRVYYKTGNIESLYDSVNNILVDHEEKMISISPALKFSGNILPDKKLFDMALKMCEKITYKNINASLACYSMYAALPEYERIDIIFNKKNYIIEGMNLYFSSKQNLTDDENAKEEKPRLEITYTSIRLSPAFAENEFSEKRFLNKNNEQYTPVAALKNYTVINQTIK